MRNKTIRKMTPTARKIAHLNNDLESIKRKLNNLLPEINKLEHDSKALKVATNPHVVIMLPESLAGDNVAKLKLLNPGIDFAYPEPIFDNTEANQ